MDVSALLSQLGVDSSSLEAGPLPVYTPIDGSALGHLTPHAARDVQAAVTLATQAFRALRDMPAPKRGELIRLFGTELRANKALLAELVSVESGKIRQEALGEVQEMIDICDFAVGLSRQLYGLTIASERAQHRMQEQWHPLGPVCVISAFNFPVAVWAWNFTLAIVCGDPVIWKPSEKTPLCALACQALWERAAARANVGAIAPRAMSQVVIGGRDVGELLVNDPRVALVSATGSTAMGRALSPKVAARFGRVLLELGGNNAMLVTPSADLKLALRAILFSAVGTAGQRCTSLRRLFLHESIHDSVIEQLTRAYGDLKIGSPLLSDTLVGPLIDRASFERMQASLEAAEKEGGKLLIGGKRVLAEQYPQAYYVQPAIVSMAQQTDIVCQETFAPILWVMSYRSLDEAIELHNAVEQGLSSCIFTNDIREAEQFLSARGSDCGIANVNIGPSGAEIGGAFGGEKATGGGRESGSDSWKNYMRRATNTINYGNELPLAQGIRFAD
ncbi:MAG TPA: aldehyde dehydrogenase family protein [Polyangiales bacterium]|nr:aldehyde dehydrogenase family protein [Polyangiales bacterium]